jgi:putative colanic acid biosynthesis acetyltransferase WcaF
MKTDLKSYDNSWYSPGRNFLARLLWHYVNAFFITSSFIPSRSVKVFFLRLFGAKVGEGVNIKAGVNIKYPWNLTVGDYSWLGEGVWIDSLARVSIGNNVVISQGAMLLTGNHDYTKSTFDLMVKEIVVEDGVWIGAQAVVCPGVICRSHSILSVGSVATKELGAYTIYQGNPAVEVRRRVMGRE